MTDTNLSFGFAYSSLRVVESVYCTEEYEDWTRVRSPSRAVRRRKQGHRQNITIRHRPTSYQIDNIIYVHPEIMRILNERVAQHTEQTFVDCLP